MAQNNKSGSSKPSSGKSGGSKGKSSAGKSSGYKGKSSGKSSNKSSGYKGKSSGGSSGKSSSKSGGYKGGGSRSSGSSSSSSGSGGYKGKSSPKSGSGNSSSASSGYKGGASRSSGSSSSSGSGSGGYKGTSASKSGTGKPSSASNGYKGKSSANKSRDSGPAGKKTHYTATTRDVERQRRENNQRRRDLQGAAVNLPNWVIENLERVTPKDRIAPALEALGAASEALGDGKYQSAVRHGERAKALSPNDATIRETIGIAAYRLGDWSKALTELRAYRRIAGESTHLPIEMDVLRALGRDLDVEKAWAELQKRGGHGLVMNEGIVVYTSYLLDKGRAEEALKISSPGRIVDKPNEAHLRLYFVAARAAAANGDRQTAKRLSDVIVLNDPGFPGWEQLESEIAALEG
jgi:hypothetical protein